VLVPVKILSYKRPQRYAVRQTLLAARAVLRQQQPDFDLDIIELKTIQEMEQYTLVLILPSLVVSEKLVCVGRFPKKEEVVGWLQEAHGGFECRA